MTIPSGEPQATGPKPQATAAAPLTVSHRSVTG